MATTSEMRFEDSPLRGSSWFQLCSSHSGEPVLPHAERRLAGRTRYPGEGWSASSVNPGLRVVNPSRPEAIQHTLASPMAHPSHCWPHKDDSSACYWCRQIPQAAATASETENAP